VLRIFTGHYNRERPHRGLALLPPDPTNAGQPPSGGEIKRRDRLGGLIHEYPPSRSMNRHLKPLRIEELRQNRQTGSNVSWMLCEIMAALTDAVR
jgi:hypothetical protein